MHIIRVDDNVNRLDVEHTQERLEVRLDAVGYYGEAEVVLERTVSLRIGKSKQIGSLEECANHRLGEFHTLFGRLEGGVEIVGQYDVDLRVCKSGS